MNIEKIDKMSQKEFEENVGKTVTIGVAVVAVLAAILFLIMLVVGLIIF